MSLAPGRYRFPPFSLDLERGQLLRGNRAIDIRPKTWALLCYLIEHSPRLATKAELLDAIWPDAVVNEASVTNCISELRAALGDSPRHPRFIEVAHGRGYRWIAPISTEAAEVLPSRAIETGEPAAQRVLEFVPVTESFVGRTSEIGRLRERFESMRRKQREIVFLTGEAGIGKSTLLGEFLIQVGQHERHLAIGRGHCIEQHGLGEPYGPIFEALSGIGRSSHRSLLTAVLRQHAPTWLSQMSSLRSADDAATTTPSERSTPERMLREMGDAIEAFTQTVPLVLTLEDLHWSDISTIDLISYLARRREPADFLLIGTLRPADLPLKDHPLRKIRADLLARRQCIELEIGFLGEAEIEEYLRKRFPGIEEVGPLRQLLFEQTSGNPMFMTAAVAFLVDRGLIGRADAGWKLTVDTNQIESVIPGTVRQMIERQIDQLGPEELTLLETASVAGPEFTTLAIAAATGLDEEDVERQCEILVQRKHFLRTGEQTRWPDDSLGMRYSFIHALYVQALYERVSPSARRRIHRRMGDRLEAGWMGDTASVCLELAHHFELGGDPDRAVQYLRESAGVAMGRGAPGETVEALERALEIVSRAPNSPAREVDRLMLLISIASSTQSAYGFPAARAEVAAREARDLARRLGLATPRFSATASLLACLLFRGRLAECHQLSSELLELEATEKVPMFSLVAGVLTSCVNFSRGELRLACERIASCLDIEAPRLPFARPDMKLIAHTQMARAWTLRGRIALGNSTTERFLTMGAENGPLELVFALSAAAMRTAILADPEATLKFTHEALRWIDQYALTRFLPWVLACHGWARVLTEGTDDGIDEIRQALDQLNRKDAEWDRPWMLSLLAESLTTCGRPLEAADEIDRGLALVDKNEDRWAAAELLRMRGACLLTTTGDVGEAQRQFEKAIDTARRQEATLWELRATTNLARQWIAHGRETDAREILTRVRSQFGVEDVCTDVRDADVLLTQFHPPA